MQLKEQAFDPRTCITAGQLREAGFNVPKHLPDSAWMPRRAIKQEFVGAERLPGNKAAITMRLTFSEPWRWAEFTEVINSPGGDS